MTIMGKRLLYQTRLLAASSDLVHYCKGSLKTIFDGITGFSLCVNVFRYCELHGDCYSAYMLFLEMLGLIQIQLSCN